MVSPFRIERPLLLFGTIGALLAVIAVVLVVPLAVTYAATGLVPRLPTAARTGLMILGFLNLFTGLILDMVVHGRREVRRLAYLAYSAPGRGNECRLQRPRDPAVATALSGDAGRSRETAPPTPRSPRSSDRLSRTRGVRRDQSGCRQLPRASIAVGTHSLGHRFAERPGLGTSPIAFKIGDCANSGQLGAD